MSLLHMNISYYYCMCSPFTVCHHHLHFMMSSLMNLIDNALILLNAEELTNRFHVAVHLFGNRSDKDVVKMW